MLLKDNTFTLLNQESFDTLVSDIIPNIKEGDQLILHIPFNNVDYSSIKDKYDILLLNPLPRTDEKCYGFKEILKDISGDLKIHAYDTVSEEALKKDGVDFGEDKDVTIHIADEINESNFDDFVSRFKGNDVGLVNKYLTYKKSDFTIYSLYSYEPRVFSFDKSEVPDFLKPLMVNEDKRLTMILLNQNQMDLLQ